MISQFTIDKVKETAVCSEVIGDFVKLNKSGANYTCKCMFHDDKSPSFTIKDADNFYKCFGCGESGDAIEFIIKFKKWTYQQAIEYLCNKYKILMESADEPKKYVKPVFKNNTTLSDNAIKWFETRGIKQNTLIALKVTEGKEYMPQVKAERNTIQFNYFRNEELVNTKYRDGAKNFKLVSNAELIFYNLDTLKTNKDVYIVEGEMDCLSLIQSGITNAISVPNGASKGNNNLTYLDNCIELFENTENIYLALDNDINGRKLREDLAERFGKEKCKYIEWKECKDCNEVLIKYGIQGVIECCSAKKEFPLIGVFPTSMYAEELKDLYHNGLDMGVGIGIPEFDKLLKFSKGYLTVVTGISSHGKSSMLDQICVLLSLKHNWKFAFYSPENRPTKLHLSNIIRKLVGKNWFGSEKLSEVEMNHAVNWLEGRIYFIKPEKDFTLKSVLDHAKQLKQRHGIDGIIFDSWNKFEHKLGKTAETQYISEQLDLLLNFLETNSMHGFLVAHPTKMEKDKTNPLNYVVPNLYSIAGSAAFFSKADNGICVYRDYTTGKTKLFVQKVRFSHHVELGFTEWDYDRDSGRFNVSTGGLSIKDVSNWITKENRQAAIEIPEQINEVGIILNDDESPF